MMDKYRNIPEALKARNQWVCYELVYDNEKGKSSKIPKNPHNGYNAKSNDSATWSDYNTAVTAAKRYRFDGIGFELGNGIFGIDLDNAIDENGKLTKEAADIVSVMESYTEISPSRRGLHILCKGGIPVGRRRKGNIEIYSSDRFFTVTGDVWGEKKEIEERSYQAGLVYEAYLCGADQESARNIGCYKKAAQVAQLKPWLTDSEIIETASNAQNGDLFKRLWNGSYTDYKSQSEADQALCNILAFYCGNDFKRIDNLFCRSRLYREKWDRLDYKTKTINKAIADCNKTFCSNGWQNYSSRDGPQLFKSKPSKVPSYINQRINSKTGEIKFIVNCPLLAKYIREHNDYLFVTDETNSSVMRYWYKDGCYRLLSDDMIKGIIKGYITSFDEKILKMSDVNEVFNDLITDLKAISQNELNSNEDIINFQNGILDLKTMQLLPHSPRYYTTIQIPCDWAQTAKPTPIFDEFMRTFTNNDEEIQKLLMQFIGVCLSNVKGHRMKKAIFMVGDGDTGKSQLKALTERLLGQGNYTGIDLKELESRFGSANIYNKRLAGSSDMSFMTIEELKTFKKCTGGDTLFAEFKGKNGFNFVYNGLLWFCMNRLPKFGGDNGDWVHNRIIQIRCNNVIPPDKQDKFLLDKMYKERCGIVYKAINALKEVIANGYEFTIPESVECAKEEYKAENSTVISFYKECIVPRPSSSINDNCTTQRVYEMYREWCKDNNHGYAETAREFRKNFSKLLGGSFEEVTITRHGIKYYKDVTLSIEYKKANNSAYGYDTVDSLCESWETS